VPRHSGRSELLADDAVVEAIASAQFAASRSEVREHGKQPAVHAWHHAGVVCANHLIDFHRERLAAELAEAQREWDTPTRLGAYWEALINGYRTTLIEYDQRGRDE
jgi:hypothetical protein